jgi:hypothetical protein
VDGTGAFEVGTTGGAAAGTLTVDQDGVLKLDGAINATVIDNGVIRLDSNDTLVLAGSSIATAIDVWLGCSHDDRCRKRRRREPCYQWWRGS